MPSTFFCLPLRVGYVICGIFNWIMLVLSSLVLYNQLMEIQTPVHQFHTPQQKSDEYSLLISGCLGVIAFLVPSVSWLWSCCSNSIKPMKTYATSLLIFPMLVNWFFIAKITEAYLNYSNLMASSINSGVTLGSEVQKTTSLLAMYSGVVLMLCMFDIYCYYCVWAVIGTFEKVSETAY